MTDLSPAAQAVLDAAMNTPEECPYEYDIAVALEAAADQVVPEDDPKSFVPGTPRLFAMQRRTTRRQLLAIAAELRGATTTDTP